MATLIILFILALMVDKCGFRKSLGVIAAVGFFAAMPYLITIVFALKPILLSWIA